ncbi:MULTISPECIES: pentapeptide repeat-containing protein [Micromonospora]|uniref:pentapeptide repeat-containing protein n=1 Tax=Micromonospora TaxID=1873 RepID=UPI0009F19DFE
MGGRDGNGCEWQRSSSPGADLRGASLRGVSFAGCDLRGADLSYARFSYVMTHDPEYGRTDATGGTNLHR